jgi:hypothetical protein
VTFWFSARRDELQILVLSDSLVKPLVLKAVVLLLKPKSEAPDIHALRLRVVIQTPGCVFTLEHSVQECRNYKKTSRLVSELGILREVFTEQMHCQKKDIKV